VAVTAATSRAGLEYRNTMKAIEEQFGQVSCALHNLTDKVIGDTLPTLFTVAVRLQPWLCLEWLSTTVSGIVGVGSSAPIHGTFQTLEFQTPPLAETTIALPRRPASSLTVCTTGRCKLAGEGVDPFDVVVRHVVRKMAKAHIRRLA